MGIKVPGNAAALLNPEAVKAKAFDILCQLDIRGSRKRALVLVLEDLHWVDQISEEFIGFLAENAAGARILLLGTYRPGYRPPWIDKPFAGQTPLRPLSRDDSLQVVRSVVDTQSLIDLVTEEIVTRADGNPFFLEQLALHAGEARGRLLDFMVPNTIHDVMMARIDRLPPEAKGLLQTAAVIGREFSPRLLQAVWKGPEPLETQLRELSRLEFVYERIVAERAYLCLPACPDAGNGLWQPPPAASPRPVAHLTIDFASFCDSQRLLVGVQSARSSDQDGATASSILDYQRAVNPVGSVGKCRQC